MAKKKKVLDIWEQYKDVMPEHIIECPDYIKNKWLKWYKLGLRSEQHPDRYFEVSTVNGVEPIDCRGLKHLVKDKLLKYSQLPEDLREINRRIAIFDELKRQKIAARKELTKAYKGFSGQPTPSVLEYKKSELLELFGEHRNIKEVHKIVVKEHKLAVSINEVQQFFAENKEKIDYLRSEYVLRNKDFKVATDTGRMEILSDLLYHWTQQFNANPTIDRSREIRNILEQARKEIKGDEVHVTVDGRIDVVASQRANKTIDEILSKLPINLLIIGLVAAKANINPAEIIASLTNSYYRGFNGFNDLDNLDQAPSMRNFIQKINWKDIQTNYSDERKVATLAEYEEIEEAKTIRIEERKSDLEDVLMKFKSLKGLDEFEE